MAFPHEHIPDEQLHRIIAAQGTQLHALTVEFQRRQMEKELLLSKQSLELADKLSTQTNRLVEETVALRNFAEAQVKLAHRLDSLTKWLIWLTMALLVFAGVQTWIMHHDSVAHDEERQRQVQH